MAFAQYSVENAKSNRSTCKVCKAKIEKDALRIGTATEGPGDYLMTSWRHLECQKKPKNGLTDLTELAGMDALTADDQERVKTWFAAASAPKAPKSATASSGGKKRAADDAPTGDSSAADLSGVNVKKMKAGDRKAALEASGLPTSGKKKDQEELLQDVADRHAAEAKFNPMTVNDLKELCRLNSQKISGNKQCAPASGPTNQCPSRLSLSSRHRVLRRVRVCSRRELVDRVVDGSLYGGLPRCGTCSVAVLKVRYPSKYGHKGQGQFFCPGYFDDDVFRRCGFSASDVDRPKWVAAVGQASSSSSPAAPKSSKPKEAKKATPPAPKVAMPGDDD